MPRPGFRLVCCHASCLDPSSKTYKKPMSITTLFEHMSYHVLNDIRSEALFNSKCHQCGAKFLTKAFLLEHIRVHPTHADRIEELTVSGANIVKIAKDAADVMKKFQDYITTFVTVPDGFVPKAPTPTAPAPAVNPAAEPAPAGGPHRHGHGHHSQSSSRSSKSGRHHSSSNRGSEGVTSQSQTFRPHPYARPQGPPTHHDNGKPSTGSTPGTPAYSGSGAGNMSYTSSAHGSRATTPIQSPAYCPTTPNLTRSPFMSPRYNDDDENDDPWGWKSMASGQTPSTPNAYAPPNPTTPNLFSEPPVAAGYAPFESSSGRPSSRSRDYQQAQCSNMSSTVTASAPAAAPHQSFINTINSSVNEGTGRTSRQERAVDDPREDREKRLISGFSEYLKNSAKSERSSSSHGRGRPFARRGSSKSSFRSRDEGRDDSRSDHRRRDRNPDTASSSKSGETGSFGWGTFG